jgi:hypothetical protein
MEHRSVLRLSARDTPYTAIVEPWAEEFEVSPGPECRVVAIHPSALPSFDVELYHGALVVSVLESGSTYEFWRGGVREFFTPVAIPEWPPAGPIPAEPDAPPDRGRIG